MNRLSLAALLLFAFTFATGINAAEPNEEQFFAIAQRAKTMDDTPKGKKYNDVFVPAIQKPLGDAIQGCLAQAKPPVVVNLVFVIGGDGKVRHVFSEPGKTVSMCVAAKLEGVKLPKPPEADWLLLVDITLHN